jgi:hypothetical protein
MTESNASSLDLRDWTFPEEDRHLYTSATWRGEYRWFRSSNVVPLEQWRKKHRSLRSTGNRLAANAPSTTR